MREFFISYPHYPGGVRIEVEETAAGVQYVASLPKSSVSNGRLVLIRPIPSAYTDKQVMDHAYSALKGKL